MNPLLSAMSRFYRRPLLASGKTRARRRKIQRQRPCLELLEDRCVPTALVPSNETASASYNYDLTDQYHDVFKPIPGTNSTSGSGTGVGTTSISAGTIADDDYNNYAPSSSYTVDASSFLAYDHSYIIISENAQSQINSTLKITAGAGDDPTAEVLVTVTITKTPDTNQISVTASAGKLTQSGQYIAHYGDTIPVEASTSIIAVAPFTVSPGHVGGSVEVSVQQLPGPPVWTGDGSDNLWSDGNNWRGGIAPKAGDDLLFPTGAKQLSSDNDLGYSFNSVTIQDNYKFSGQTLTVAGPLDVQKGSAELDCSTTVNGTTTVEAGATLTVGNGATLNAGGSTAVVAVADPATEDGVAQPADSTDSLVVKGKLSVLNNSACNINGDASVSNSGTLFGAAGCSVATNAQGTLSVLGKLNLAPGANFTLGIDSELDAGAGGAVNTSGMMTLNGKTSIDTGDNWTAGATSKTLFNSTLTDAGKTQFDDGSNFAYGAKANVKVAAGGTVNSAGTKTANVGSVETIAAGATYTDLSGSTAYVYGTSNIVGTCQINAGANDYAYSGAIYNFSGQWNCAGNYFATASAQLPNGVQINFNAGKLSVTGGKFSVGINDPLLGFGFIKVKAGVLDVQGKVSGLITINDGDAITVAAGATLDVSGSLTEDGTGHLDDSGTVIIEPGASLDNFTSITIEQGGLLNDSAKITIEPAGVLDVMGGLSVSNTGSLNISGTMNVANGATYNSQGTVTVEPGGALNLPKTSSTALSGSTSTPRAGVDLVTLTATVTGQGSSNGTPTGTVDFIDSATKTDLGQAALVNGVASPKVGPFAEGTHTIAATYSGDSAFLSSSGTTTLTVQASPPSTAPAPPPSLNMPPLLSLFNSLFGGGAVSVNFDGSETVTDSFFGIPLLVSTFDSSGNLESVTIFGIDFTFLFLLL